MSLSRDVSLGISLQATEKKGKIPSANWDSLGFPFKHDSEKGHQFGQREFPGVLDALTEEYLQDPDKMIRRIIRDLIFLCPARPLGSV